MQGMDAKKYAHILWMVSDAVSKKVIPKAGRCQQCGYKGRLDGHHPDYTRPLFIIWLCRRCHQREHHPGWLLGKNGKNARKRGGGRQYHAERLMPEIFESDDHKQKMIDVDIYFCERTLKNTKHIRGKSRDFAFLAG